MADIKEWVSDFSPRERAALDEALRVGEHVRWATRPLRPCRGKDWLACILLEVMGVMFIVISSFALVGLCISPPEFSFFGQVLAAGAALLFLLTGLHIALLPWKMYRTRCRTLYVLTNHRALVFTPGRVEAYPLHENMLRARVCRPGGSGDLIFRSPPVASASFDDAEPGFRRLPDLAVALRELNAAIYALLDAAESQRRP